MNLQIQNATKTYPGGVKALDNVTLDIQSGMYGLLGPNGAGKSTLMRILATLLQPDSGSIMLDAINLLSQPDSIRSILGYLPQEFGLYDDLSAEKMLHHLAILKGITSKPTRTQLVNQLLNQTNLSSVCKQKLGTFSGGMRRRFGIAQALISNPKLLIVDEPTAGLDPEERRRFYNILSEASENRIVLLSTHIVEDVSVLCPGMAILNKGQVLYTGDPNHAMAPLKGKLWKADISNTPDWNDLLAEYQVLQSRRSGGRLTVHFMSDTDPITQLTSIRPGLHITSREPDLEDAYFYYLHATASSSDGDSRHVH